MLKIKLYLLLSALLCETTFSSSPFTPENDVVQPSVTLNVTAQNNNDELNMKLITAVQNNDHKEVEKCLKLGANPNMRIRNHSSNGLLNLEPSTIGESPKKYDPDYRGLSIDVVQILIDYGIDPISMNREGRNSLFYARRSDVLNLLIKRGASIHAKDMYGRTAIHNCVDFDRINRLALYEMDVQARCKKIATLSNLGIDVNAIDDEYGQIALHMACFMPHPDLIMTLIVAGSNIFISDKKGETCAALLTKGLTEYENNPNASARFEESKKDYSVLKDSVILALQIKQIKRIFENSTCSHQEVIKSPNLLDIIVSFLKKPRQ